MAELNEQVTKLLADADEAKTKAKDADKEYTIALKALNSAQRAEKKAKEVVLQAHKDAVTATHAVVEYLLGEVKDAGLPAEPEMPSDEGEATPSVPVPDNPFDVVSPSGVPSLS